MQNSPNYSIVMGSIICGAMTRAKTPCNRLAVAGSKRCHLHGGYCTGPVTPMGKLRCGDTLRLYRITDGGRGKPKTNKARLRRELAAKRALRTSRAQARAERWQNRQKIASGAPLYTQDDDLLNQSLSDLTKNDDNT